uniref:Uncharacterized protein n=1 Tax=Spumella elongata TaxID=89044 RepID=A0A7S3HU60_9STRA|mmetsp:Transcript_9798/g.17019  ORF Transcript_9798/g.17019 Transcript_9798/m.17019 type:complete len:224 (+) Transcript_9798:59-730(+)|eukprot:CAMPEP_0184992672 /NCGR_PEP_ID=MMETSP1098-20130426/42143_1 /TAXON_ID=89044 /ORGANISM="Spumella elongata, Strain CCAP 955/1" /LENGTH=223 /DNA_ID=CAMNT_0027518341 /DNA_START=59 /DNA_END=730 /DNA_ORIENTATION=-
MSGTKSESKGLNVQMDSLLSESLPEALSQLSQRHESFGQVVQYLEDNYIASQRSGKDKMIIEEEAKRFVTKGLVNVLKDIETASINLDQLIQLQGLSIDSLNSDVSLITSRLHGMKSQHLTASLDEMKSPYIASSSSTAVPAQRSAGPQKSVRKVEVDYLTTSRKRANSNEQSELGSATEAKTEESSTTVEFVSAAPAPRRKLSMEERLAQLDNIGVGSGRKQ